MHLNVVLPLNQCGPEVSKEKADQVIFNDVHHSQDPLIQKFVQDYRNKFRLLKNSPNPILREYYRRKCMQSANTRSTTQQARLIQQVTEGKETNIFINSTRYWA